MREEKRIMIYSKDLIILVFVIFSTFLVNTVQPEATVPSGGEISVLEQIERYKKARWKISPKEVKKTFADKSFGERIEKAGGAVRYEFGDKVREENAVVSFSFFRNELFIIKISFEEDHSLCQILKNALESKYGKPKLGPPGLFAKGDQDEFVELKKGTSSVQVAYIYHHIFARWLRKVELEKLGR